MKRTVIITLFAAIVGAGVAVFAYTQIVPFPYDITTRADAFEPENRDWFYQNASEVFPTRTVRKGDGQPFERVEGQLDGFSFEYAGRARTLSDLFTDMETSGLIILHKGKLVYEKYDRGATSGTHLATFSLIKSFTSTLVGFAVGENLIKNVEDPLTDYLPELAGTAYDGVTIKQALEMSSGVRFDPDGPENAKDTVQFVTDSVVTGKKPAFDIAVSYPRAVKPGTVFNYNTAETQILLELVRRVTGKPASVYLEEKLWQPLGMVHDAGWVLDAPGRDGVEIGGAFFNASLLDWAKFGQFIEQNGAWNGEQLLPPDWVGKATRSKEPHLQPGKVHPNPNRGYAWQWWTYPDGTFEATGANGQTLYIDEANNIVVARSGAWTEGWVKEHDEETFAFFKALGEWDFSKSTALAQESNLAK
ncbi:serine hydrolase [Parasphingorhabdus sp.]